MKARLRPSIRRRAGAMLSARKASVSVEFALVSLFFLFPLMAGSMDMILALSARSKLDSALHSLYLFAWSNPQNAADPATLNAYLRSIDPALPASGISLVGNPATQSLCFGSDGNIDLLARVTPPVLGGSGADTCNIGPSIIQGDVPVIIVHYVLQSTINLPVPVPFIANPVVLTASGTVQTN